MTAPEFGFQHGGRSIGGARHEQRAGEGDGDLYQVTDSLEEREVDVSAAKGKMLAALKRAAAARRARARWKFRRLMCRR